MAGVLERNIGAVIARRRQDARERRLSDRLADRITTFTGSMTFVALHLLVFGGWIVVNLGWTPVPPFDPTFVVLAMIASVEAIFLSTFVLITQNRMAEVAAKQADLDLQISLLAEHETTRLITLTAAIAEHLGVTVPHSEELPELERDVAPEQVLERIEHHERRHERGETSGGSR
jgi:uncharacterized membrane protein